MAHFAKLDNDNNVIAVHVVNNDVITVNGVESEQAGIDFLNHLYNESAVYKQTSYNGSFRKNYAGVGFKYDPSRDAFIPSKPFASWILNEETCQWEAPVAYPTDGFMHRWDEATNSWINPTI